MPLEVPNEPGGVAPLGSIAEVEPGDFLEALAQADELGGQFVFRRVPAAPSLRLPDPFPDRPGERLVVGVTLLPETPPKSVVRPRFEEFGLADIGLTACRDGLLSDPLQILETVVPPRKRIHGILQRDGSNSRQPLPDLRPQIERFGRELVNQEIPGQMADAATALPHGLGSLTPLK